MRPDTSNTIFQKAISFVNQTNRHLFITGKAGTGKTTFLKFIKEHSYKNMAVVAPTGVAAINAGGMTIHSFFQLPLSLFLPTDGGLWGGNGREVNNRSTLAKHIRLNVNKRTLMQELDLLVIDEISMVRADLLDAIDFVLRFVRKQPLRPFGGVQMVYIGDLFQLPPVVKNEDWELLKNHYQSPFFFSAHALQQTHPLYLELKKIYRQKDSTFINILNNVRNNTCTTDDLTVLHKRYHPTFSPSKDAGYITLTTHNSKADVINHTELDNLPGKLFAYYADVTGEFSERSYPADKELRLKEGAQVMFIKNDKGEARRFFNGKIGTIKRLENDKITVTFPNESAELELEKEKWENIQYNYDTKLDSVKEEELGTFTQYPLRLAWAITIHKSQGLTFEKAIVDAGASFAAGQVYVSLSRLTSLQGLVLQSEITASSISTDKRVIEYAAHEADEQTLQNELEKSQKIYVRHLLLQSFVWSKVHDAIAKNLEEYDHRQIPDKELCAKWGRNLAIESAKLMDVTEKFCRKLEYLLTTCEEDNYKVLHERTKAACKYFTEEVNGTLLQPLLQHIEEVKIKQKTRRYVNELLQLSNVLNKKNNQLQQALQLAEALYKSADIKDLLIIAGKTKEEELAEKTEENATRLKPKMPKGESSRISLEMYKKGKSIADIAAAREMAFSTIEGHLASFVATGEIHIAALVSKEHLEILLEIVTNNPELSQREIKMQAGEAISYGAVKAVCGHAEYLKG